MLKRNVVGLIAIISTLFAAHHSFSMSQDRGAEQIFVTRLNSNKKFSCSIEYNSKTQMFSSFDVYAAVEKALGINRRDFTIIATGPDFGGKKELSKRQEEFFPVQVLFNVIKGDNAFHFKPF